MRSLQLTIAVLALAATAAGQCWTNNLCDYNEDSENKVVFDPNDVLYNTFEKQMTACQAECVANTDIICSHFSVFTSRSIPTCYLLTDCDSSTTPACLELGTCNSGPKDCASNFNCPVLTAPATGDYIPWQCDGDVNPYTQQIPEDTTCFLSCKSWVTTEGVPAQVTSSCVKGSTEGEWTASAINGAAEADVPALTGAALPQPDAETQIACTCAIQPMTWDPAGLDINYDPNTLPGTDFICTGGVCDTDPLCYLTGDVGSKVFQLEPAFTCRLFCDSYHIATMACDGVWTGEPELGAWCYAEPTADDDVNASG